MTNLEKDTAIYNELLKIANEVFQNAAKKSEWLRGMLKDNGGSVKIDDILKRKSPYYAAIKDETDNEVKIVRVDGFEYKLWSIDSFFKLEPFRKLAEIRKKAVFTYKADEDEFDEPSETENTHEIPETVVATEAEEEITVAKKERKYIDFCDL